MKVVSAKKNVDFMNKGRDEPVIIIWDFPVPHWQNMWSFRNKLTKFMILKRLSYKIRNFAALDQWNSLFPASHSQNSLFFTTDQWFFIFMINKIPFFFFLTNKIYNIFLTWLTRVSIFPCLTDEFAIFLLLINEISDFFAHDQWNLHF